MAHGARVPRLRDEIPPTPVDRLVGPFYSFMRMEAGGGIILFVCLVAALVVANSGLGEAWHHFWAETEVSLDLGGKIGLKGSLEWWINDAVMAIFFFLVGLEIKREMAIGELSSFKKAALPMFAAVGGMVVPGGIYAALNWGHPTIHGWGVPMATDIAFALGVLALLGKRVPMGLRLFMAALAIADDLGALVVIAVFYTDDLRTDYLMGAGVCAGIMLVMNLLGVRKAIAFFMVGLVLWYMVLMSGVHATIAGVIGAATIPVRTRVDSRKFVDFTEKSIAAFREDAGGVMEPGKTIISSTKQQALVQSIEDACDKVQTPLHQLEHGLVGWVAFLIVPVFALANAGVHVDTGSIGSLGGREGLGVILGLAVGKPVGITLASLFAVKVGLGQLPRGVNWVQLHGAAWLGGIGFTMALFIAHLAFKDAAHLATAKLGILVASSVACVVGAAVVLMGSKKAAGVPAGEAGH